MRKLLVLCAACGMLFAATTVNAAEPVADQTLAAMGFAGMKTVSDNEGLKVRGKGSSGYGGVDLVPFIIQKEHQVASEFALVKSLSLQVAVNLDKTFAVQKAFAEKSSFLFIGPRLSFGGFNGAH